MRQQRTKAVLLCAVLCGYAGAAIAERADRDKPVHVEADQMSIDDARQVSIFTGSVLMTQGTLSINGEQIIATQGKQGFEHGKVTGQPAGFRQKREGMDEYVEGYGARIDYDAVSGIMDIYGQAHVKRGQDDVRGDHISYNQRTEIFQVFGALSPLPDKGRVRVVIQPKSANAASDVPAAEPLSIKPDTRLINPEKKP
ncbi:MAG TPA: lipopolysaccharide transport periplasmic protein LptA [Gallionellaceae bacterium]|nr:lipopolysaccharide transport periplasmic protein LptA [Gallionellaceae bacterium]